MSLRLFSAVTSASIAITAAMQGQAFFAAFFGSASLSLFYSALVQAITAAVRAHVTYTVNNVTVTEPEADDDAVLIELERRTLFSGKVSGINPGVQ